MSHSSHLRLARFACGLAAALAAAGLAAAAAGADAGPSVLQVLVTYQEHDPFLPWQMRQPAMRAGYGIAVDAHHVITTENLVRNHRLVQLRQPRTGDRVTATVEMSDWQVGLAYLKIEDGALENLRVPDLCTNLAAGVAVDIVQFDDTSGLQTSAAHITQVKVSNLPQTPASSLVFVLLVDQNVNGEGAAVMHDGCLAGLVLGFDRNTRQASVLPYPVITDFLSDLRKDPYPGVASSGFSWKPLIDPSTRRYLGVQDREGGILVLATLPGSGAAEVLRARDVIVEWDGYPVDNLGYYEDREFGRLTFIHRIRSRRNPGDTVPVKVVRDREERVVNVRLTRHSDDAALIPENVTGDKPEYLFEGGLILRELDGNYLRAAGPDWQQKTDERLLHLYLTRRFSPQKPDERIVLLAGVLADPINAGYQEFADEIVTAVNGRPVSSMKDVFRIFERDGSIERVTLRGEGVDIVLSRQGLEAANRRLCATYGARRRWHKREEATADE